VPQNQLDADALHGGTNSHEPPPPAAEAPEKRDTSNAVPEWIQVLIGGWRILLLGAVVAGAVGGLAIYAQPKTYVAEALVAPVFSSTQVQFEPRITTVDATTQAQPSMSPERRQALLDLVNTGEIESLVINNLGGTVRSTPTQPGQLVGRVKGLQKPRSEMIAIQAEADTPEDAVAITNAWADGFVSLVNRVYATNGGTAVDKLVKQRDDAFAAYQKSQTDLTAALQSNTMDELDREIKSRELEIAMLQTPYQVGAFGSFAGTVDSGASAQSPAGSNGATTAGSIGPQPGPQAVDAQTARSDYRLADVRTLDGLAETLRRLDVSRENIKVLIAKVEANGASPSDQVAMTVLKTQLVSMTGEVPQLQLQLNGPVSSDTAAELHRLQDSIEQARSDVSTEFETRKAEFEAKSATQIAALEEQVRTLKSQLEQETTDRKELTLKRDLGWDTYTALARKVEEQSVAQSSSGRQVEIASRASVAVPALPRTIMVVAVAAVVGLIIAALVLLFPLIRSFLAPYLSRGSKQPSGQRSLAES
jgi:capsular polysaccharide biosynthesis protein